LNTCFLWPTRVRNPNGKSIDSVVFAQSRQKVPILYNGHRFPKNCPFPRRDLDPHLTHDSLGQSEPTTQTASQSFEPILYSTLFTITAAIKKNKSADFAQMTAECPYTLQWDAPAPQIALPMGIWISCTVYRLVANLVTYRVWPTLPASKLFHNRYLAHFLSKRNEIWQRQGLANGNSFPEFHELWSGGPIIPCGDMHQSFTDAHVKWFCDNLPIFANSFSVFFLFTTLPSITWLQYYSRQISIEVPPIVHGTKPTLSPE